MDYRRLSASKEIQNKLIFIIADNHNKLYDCTLSCHQPNKTRLEVQLDLLWTVVYRRFSASKVIRNKLSGIIADNHILLFS